MIRLLVILLFFSQIALAQAEPLKTVLVLYDGGREFSSIQLMDRSIDSTLSAALSNRVTVFREYMDLTRVGSANYEQVLRDFYRAKYSHNRPDVIVATRGRPLDFLLKNRTELFPGVPIVSSGMDIRQVNARKLSSDVTGITLQVKYWPTLALALKLQPETKQVVIVDGASLNDRALEALVRDELREHENQHQLKFTFLSGLETSDLMQRLSSLSPHTVVLFVSLAQDGRGRSFLPNDAVTLVSRAANAPTYINSDDVLDCGAIGGNLISFEALGRDTAKLALRILNGEKTTDIPFAGSSVRAKILDARQLERWGIPIARVPTDSTVLNRQPTMWEAYKWWIIGGTSLILLQSALIATLVLHRKQRRMAEQNLRISETNGRTAVLEERNRMARDMHDTLAQGFTGVIVQLEAAKQASAHGSAVDTDLHVNRASELARQSLGEARRSIRALRPKALEDANLCVALEGAMTQMTAGTGLQAQFTTGGKPRPLMASTEENLLRIYIEIITNALKHSSAKIIKSSLSFDQDAVRLEVQDDGGGFDFAKEHDGLGLLGIRERVNQMNGKLMIESRVGAGTIVCVALPAQALPNDSELH